MRYIKIAVIAAFALSVVILGIALGKELTGRDATLPTIESDREQLEISCQYEEGQLLEGLTAYDEKDGDLTSQIIISEFGRFIEPGLCSVTYVVFDSSDQAATLTRKLKFTDYESPRFSLTEPLVFRSEEGNYTEVTARLSASDSLDGDLTEWIQQTDSDINYRKTGTYHITFEVTNSFGDTASASLPVHVVSGEGQSLHITLRQCIVYVKPGETLNPAEYVDSVLDSQGNLLDAGIVRAEGSTEYTDEGVYEIHYIADDGAGSTGETWMTVIVRE